MPEFATDDALPKKPDAVTITLLLRARAVLEHALGHSGALTPTDGMLAIHGLDNAVEHLLRVLAHHLEIDTRSEQRVDALVDLAALAGTINKFVKDQYGRQLPALAEIKLLRQLRNLVQHGVSDPRAELVRLRSTVERFFDVVLDDYFGLGVGTIRVSSIVESTAVRSCLVPNQAHFDRSSAET